MNITHMPSTLLMNGMETYSLLEWNLLAKILLFIILKKMRKITELRKQIHILVPSSFWQFPLFLIISHTNSYCNVSLKFLKYLQKEYCSHGSHDLTDLDFSNLIAVIFVLFIKVVDSRQLPFETKNQITRRLFFIKIKFSNYNFMFLNVD